LSEANLARQFIRFISGQMHRLVKGVSPLAQIRTSRQTKDEVAAQIICPRSQKCPVASGDVFRLLGRVSKRSDESNPDRGSTLLLPVCAGTTPCIATDTGRHRGRVRISPRTPGTAPEQVVANISPITRPKT
jgi:hypothetical protein